MTKLILDQTSEIRFADLKERVEICDGSGRVLGYFIPVVNRSLYKEVEIPFSEAELRKAEEETESYTTAQVLACLETLGRTSYAGNE